jgi:hypothetical protein
LIFGVPLFAFAVLSAVFSHPVIRGLGVVIVDADRSDTSRAFVQQVAASPALSIVCPLLALSGHLHCVGRCPLSGAKRTLIRSPLACRFYEYTP